MDIIDHVIQELAKLPGIGRKSAARLTYHLLALDNTRVNSLIQAIQNLKKYILYCSICGNYSETDPCGICRDPSRDQSVVCIIEQAKDIQTIESTHEYKGLYHVLGGVISPLHGIGPNDLRIPHLLNRLAPGSINEVIIATNPTVEGDTTCLYVSKLVKEKGINVSRIALGLPVGGDLEYADKLTLSQALKGRTRI